MTAQENSLLQNIQSTLSSVFETVNFIKDNAVTKEEFNIEINGIKEEIDGMKTEIDGLKYEINGIKYEIKGMKAEIIEIKKDIVVIKVDITEIKDGIKGIKSVMVTKDYLEDRLDIFKDDIFGAIRQDDQHFLPVL